MKLSMSLWDGQIVGNIVSVNFDVTDELKEFKISQLERLIELLGKEVSNSINEKLRQKETI